MMDREDFRSLPTKCPNKVKESTSRLRTDMNVYCFIKFETSDNRCCYY